MGVRGDFGAPPAPPGGTPVPQVGAAALPRGVLDAAIAHSTSAMLFHDTSMRIVHANPAACRMFGYPLQALLGHEPGALLAGPWTDPAARAAIRRALDAGQPASAELFYYTREREPLWASVAVDPVRDDAGRVTHHVGVITDITDRRLHAELQVHVLDALAREVPAAALFELLCREAERIAPGLVASILAVDEGGRLRPRAAPSLPASFSEAIDGVPIGAAVGSCGTAAWRNEPVLVRDIATDPLWVDFKALALPLGLAACWSTPIRGADGRVLGTFAFYFREPGEPNTLHRRLVEVSVHLCTLILEREQARAHIHQLAFYDTLTGLPNRALLRSAAERALTDARRHGRPLAVAFIDLDRFKLVNDTHGHAVGDALLGALAQRLQAALRPGDVIGRLSGDEFVAVLPGCGATQAMWVAERLQKALTQPFAVEGVVLHPGASIGVALHPDDGCDIDTLIRHADMAMYQAKTQQRGGVRFFSAELNRAAVERALLEDALRDALASDDGGGLALHWQPQVGAADGTLRGVEALLRWQHPRLGPLPPLRFVPLAEECGLIGPLGRWVLARACAQLADWRARGVAVPRVAVNLSASNFLDAGLPGFIGGLLAQHGLAGGELVAELTEAVMLNGDPLVLQTVREVHALGVAISLDDFGTGYSSLGHLHRLPIRQLKLDKSFVLDIEHDELARALTVSVLRIGRSLGLDVVAEGVETEAQRRFVADEGCPVVQGYLVSRPVAAPALEAWLAARLSPAATASAVPAPRG